MTSFTRHLLHLAAAVAALVAVAFPAHADARSQSRDKDVVMLLGYDLFANHDCDLYDKLSGLLATRDGTSAPRAFHPVTYYRDSAHRDAGCTESVDGWTRTGAPATEHFGTHDATGHTVNTRIEHLGYHLAWYVNKRFSQFGKPVDVVAHSLGGLALRYAMTRVQAHDPQFPSKLLIEDVVTLGTAHGGTTGFTTADLCPGNTVQCAQMAPGSAFLASLGAHPNPNPDEATDWTVIGSEMDDTVPGTSAIAMPAANQRVLYSPLMTYFHGTLLSDMGTALDATLRYSLTPGQTLANFSWARMEIPFVQNGGVQTRRERVGSWTDRALAFSGW
jgi:hypothetical protein